MASTSVLVAVLLAAFVCDASAAGGRLVGGWQKKDVNGNELFTELAHFAVGKQVGDREFFDTVLEVTDVETQVVAGTNYRLTFKIAESTCRVTDTYTKELCRPKTQDVKDICTAVIYDVPWLNERSVSSFTCGAAAST